MGDDTFYLMGIVVFFIFLGALLPFVRSEFGSSYTTNPVDGLVDDIQDTEIDSVMSASVSMGDVALSIASMFFWTFGAIPALLDVLIFIPMRVTMIWLFIRMARGV